MSTRFLIIDDESRARSVIRKHIERLGDTTIVDECEHPLQAIEVLRKHSIDLIILDIEMPEMDGLRFLGTLNDPPGVIITTAFSEYAMDGFELDVIDYLLKPVTFERFVKAVNKFYHLHQAGASDANKAPNCRDAEFIYLNENNKVLKIYLEEIQYLEELNNKVRIHLDHRQLEIQTSLQDIEKKLPRGPFIKIQSTCMVAVSKIRAFNSTSIELEYASLPIGRKYKDQTISALNYNKES